MTTNNEKPGAASGLSAAAGYAFRHRRNLLEYLMQGKRLIRKTADSADFERPEYWALEWNGETIESVGFARRVYPGWQMFLDFLADPMPWTVDAADIAWEPEVPPIQQNVKLSHDEGGKDHR